MNMKVLRPALRLHFRMPTSNNRHLCALCTVKPKLPVSLNKDINNQNFLKNTTSFRCLITVSENLTKNDEFVDSLYEGILNQERGHLARGITLIESTHPKKKQQAQLLLNKILQHSTEHENNKMAKPLSFRIGMCIFPLTRKMITVIGQQ